MRTVLALVILMLGFNTQGLGQEIHPVRYQHQHFLVRGLTSDRVFVIGGETQGRTPRPFKASPVAIKFGEAALSPKNQSLPNSAFQIEECQQVVADGAVKDPCLLDRVFFPFSSAFIPVTEEADLLRAVEELPQGTKLQVRGFTCDLGSQAFNDHLALERANRVASNLRDQGFAVEVAAQGKCTYLTRNPKKRALNRRVEITLRGSELRQQKLSRLNAESLTNTQ